MLTRLRSGSTAVSWRLIGQINRRLSPHIYAFFSSVAEVIPEVRIPIDAERVPFHVRNVVSKETANQKQITQMRVSHQIQKLQLHKGDTGSAGVQIGVMTEKILNGARHFASHKKDKGSLRGFQILIQKRRKMMIYLKRTDFVQYQKVIKELNLYKEDRTVTV